MARLPRLVLPGCCHWVVQRGLPGRAAFVDASDREAYRDALFEAARAEQVQLHAYALTDEAVHLLATPAQAAALGRVMQAIGRRYVSAYNRRHGGRGTLWDGRYRAAPVEPGALCLEVLALIDGLAEAPGSTSAAHRCSDQRQAGLVDPPEFWTLGNTPFERQAAWRQRLAEGLGTSRRTALLRAALGNWAVGSSAFAARLAQQTARPTQPRPRGRPRAH
jgi:putative transposase